MSTTGRTHSVGRPLRRSDGEGKVRGEAGFPLDRAAPEDCLVARTVRLPVASARIDEIDSTEAQALPGVIRIVTARDVPGTNRFGLIEPDQPVLAEDYVRGASDVVALVLADDDAAAEAGARAVRVRYTPQPPLVDAEAALLPTAPVVHSGRAGGQHPNLLAERRVRRGDGEGALAEAHLVVSGTYRTERVEHFFLAPEAGQAMPQPDGSFALFVATQWPEADLDQASSALSIPRDRLRIVQETVGGAFGGREDISIQILLLLGAQLSGRPVRMAWEREESVRGHGKRHPFRMHHRLGLDRDGRFVAATLDLLIDAGCYASTSRQVLDNALAHAFGPYRIDHVEARGRAVFTNNPYTCAFRGFGVNQATFAMEQQVNKAAAVLGVAPAELRERNLVRPPTIGAMGFTIVSGEGLRETVEVAWRNGSATELPAPDGSTRHGRGFATAMKNIGYGFGHDDHATAEVHWTAEGVVVRVGAAEVGQGAETALTQIAADALGVDPATIRLDWRDSSVSPEAGSSSASRQTMASGNAVLAACTALRDRIEASEASDLPAKELRERATWRFPETDPFHVTPGRHLATFGWGACVADVAVDVETGQVTVLRVTQAVDAGRVVNPALARGQVDGGVVMGQGYALQEECRVVDGMPVTLGFESGGVPTAVDAAPTIEAIFIEQPDAHGPFGVRGIGEITMIPVVPAITAAIHDACGAWIDHLPASPTRIRTALAAERTPTVGETSASPPIDDPGV